MSIETSASFFWDLGELPFLWVPLSTPRNPPGFPDTLPFSLGVAPDTGALTQRSDARVTAALARAYASGSMIPGMMEEEGFGRRYADDFERFIVESIDRRPVGGLRVLEIGCGTGYLLSRLAAKGADVVGIEPGELGARGARRYGIRIVRDVFPSAQVSGEFDLVLLPAVLEHLEAPARILGSIRALVRDRGRIVLSVPDCAAYIDAGDISCLVHEHWSYFTTVTLGALLRSAGFADVRIEPGRYGGTLLASARPERDPAAGETGVRASIATAERYRELARRAGARFASIVQSRTSAGRSVGIFVPSRAINLLHSERVRLDRVRFFDDQEGLHGTFFPGIGIAVESRVELAERPTDAVIIMSRTFGAKIAAELRELLSARTELLTWDDVFQA